MSIDKGQHGGMKSGASGRHTGDLAGDAIREARPKAGRRFRAAAWNITESSFVSWRGGRGGCELFFKRKKEMKMSRRDIFERN